MRTPRLLVVCTANQCRSPIAASFAQTAAEHRGLRLNVRSGGFMPGGAPATPATVAAMAHFDVDLSDHQSHQIGTDDLEWADIIITMERRHLVGIADLDLRAVDRSFPIRELIRIGESIEGNPALREWAVQIGAKRDPRRVLEEDRHDDVIDPTGRSLRRHIRCATEIRQLTDEVIRIIP